MQGRVLGWFRRHPYDALLSLLAVMIFAAEYLRASGYHGRLLVALVAAAVPLAAVTSLLSHRAALYAGVLLGIPATAAITQDALGLRLVPDWVVLVCPLGIFLLASFVIVRHLVSAPQADPNLVRGAVAGYLMIGYTWAIAFEVCSYLEPGAFLIGGAPSSGPIGMGAATYLSFITLTTLGYGDIVPLGTTARALTISEAILGVMYLAIIVSRLVTAQRDASRDGDVE